MSCSSGDGNIEDVITIVAVVVVLLLVEKENGLMADILEDETQLKSWCSGIEENEEQETNAVAVVVAAAAAAADDDDTVTE
jgi:hypothetical protein